MSCVKILNKDTADQSLVNYKKALLKNVKMAEIGEEKDPEVEVVSIEFVCPDRPQGPITLNFHGDDLKKKADKFRLLEGCKFHVRIRFRVHNEIVYGLKFCNIVKIPMMHQKSEEVMGTFAPSEEDHEVNLEDAEAPKGFFKRGDYEGKAMLADSDGNIHL